MLLTTWKSLGACLLTITILLPASAAERDWAQWRGPNRDGISEETGLLKEWPESGPQLLWRVRGLGRGFASVAIADGTIYTQGKREGQTQLIALRQSDGESLWSIPFGSGGDPNGTPTVDAGLVYAVSFDGDLVCADAESGQVVWKKRFSDDFGGKMMSQWGFSESPLVDGDRLICTPGGQKAMLAALNKKTGAPIWTTVMPDKTGPKGQDGAAYSSVVVSNAAGLKQYVQLVGRGIIGVDARNGRLQWGYNRVANGTANIPTPIIKGDLVFVSTGYGDGGSALLKLSRSRRSIRVQEVYYREAKQLQNHHGGMILLKDHIYMGHGHNNGFPVCFQMQSGQEAWRPGRGPGRGSAAVAYADGHLYFRYEDGTMALIEASPSRYQLKGSFKLASNNGKSWALPVIADGKLYVRDQDELLCYDLRQ